MKTTLTLIALLFCLQLSAQKSKTEASREDYVELAQDMCGCVESNAKGLSPGMREVLIKSGYDPSQMEALMQEFMMEHLEEGMNDIEVLQNIGDGMDKCVNKLSKKYKNIYSHQTEEEIQAMLVDILGEEKGCELTYALMMIGLNSESEE